MSLRYTGMGLWYTVMSLSETGMGCWYTGTVALTLVLILVLFALLQLIHENVGVLVTEFI